MAISFVGAATPNSATNGNDVTLDLTTVSGLAEGDLVIVAYSIGDSDGVDFDMGMVTAGYTEVSDIFLDDTYDANLGVFYKFMGSTVDTEAVADGQGGSDASVAAVAMVFRGVATVAQGGPFDTTRTEATGVDTANPNPPSINHSGAAGTWTVIAAGSYHIANQSTTYTFPTGYTTNPTSTGGNDTTDCTVGLGYKTSPSDPEDPGTLTFSGTDFADYCWAAVTMALKVVSSQQHNQSVAATMTLTSAAIKRAGKGLSASVAATAGLATSKVKQLAIAVTSAVGAILSRRAAKTLTATAAIGAAVSRGTRKALGVAATVGAAIGKRWPKTVAVTSAVSAALSKVWDALGPDLARMVKKSVPTGLSAFVEMARQFIAGGGELFYQTVDAAVTLGAALSRRVGKAVAAGVTLASSLLRSTRKLAQIAITMSLSASRAVRKTIAQGISLAAGLVKRVFLAAKNIGVALTPGLEAVKQAGAQVFYQTVAAATSLTATLRRRVAKSLVVATPVVAGLIRQTRKILAAATTVGAAVAKRVATVLSVTTTVVAAMARDIVQTYFIVIATTTNLVVELGHLMRKIIGRTTNVISMFKRGSSPKSW